MQRIAGFWLVLEYVIVLIQRVNEKINTLKFRRFLLDLWNREKVEVFVIETIIQNLYSFILQFTFLVI